MNCVAEMLHLTEDNIWNVVVQFHITGYVENSVPLQMYIPLYIGERGSNLLFEAVLQKYSEFL
jgi:hypothetical protein